MRILFVDRYFPYSKSSDAQMHDLAMEFLEIFSQHELSMRVSSQKEGMHLTAGWIHSSMPNPGHPACES